MLQLNKSWYIPHFIGIHIIFIDAENQKNLMDIGSTALSIFRNLNFSLVSTLFSHQKSGKKFQNFSDKMGSSEQKLSVVRNG